MPSRRSSGLSVSSVARGMAWARGRGGTWPSGRGGGGGGTPGAARGRGAVEGQAVRDKAPEQGGVGADALQGLALAAARQCPRAPQALHGEALRAPQRGQPGHGEGG